MKTQITEQAAHKNAKLKVEFRIHLVTYIVVNSLLAIINLALTPGYLWFVWPLMGWGIGIISHGISVRNSTSPSLKERMIAKELRKTGLVISLMILVANIHAQDSQPLTSVSGYGGPMFSVTQLNNEPGLIIGGKGGAVFNEKLAFGGIGFGTVHPIQLTGNNLSDEVNTALEMTYGAGGVFFEYVFNYGDRIDFSVPLNLMAGGVHVIESGTETEIESSALFILEPGISIDFRISKFYSQSFFISYRQAIGSSLENLKDRNISGFHAGLLFKFCAR